MGAARAGDKFMYLFVPARPSHKLLLYHTITIQHDLARSYNTIARVKTTKENGGNLISQNAVLIPMQSNTKCQARAASSNQLARVPCSSVFVCTLFVTDINGRNYLTMANLFSSTVDGVSCCYFCNSITFVHCVLYILFETIICVIDAWFIK